jgi:hypothetical protein
MATSLISLSLEFSSSAPFFENHPVRSHDFCCVEVPYSIPRREATPASQRMTEVREMAQQTFFF